MKEAKDGEKEGGKEELKKDKTQLLPLNFPST